MNLGNKISEIRKKNKMSQEEFAELFNVTRQTISSWENSKSYPDIETLIKISDKFNISLDILLKEDKVMIKKIDKERKNYKIIKIVLLVLLSLVIIFGSIYYINYINFSKKYNIVKDEIEIVIQVNGKLKEKLSVANGLTKEEQEKLVMERENTKQLIGDKTIVKVVSVPGKLVNIVVK